ncbi:MULTISPECIES: tRNA (adenosine(37)-N6)-threonylcarbamoyltransferase complex dimerization subunit type 1 TsaB [unclassified Marinobacter]|uniref:tRNA (adenosine(37)-N6)-threonylcarbamoyltransferase complex dimerization subunit type 1 TsaB n=1 Tax=unclassified Marinobacter TaxID=83889 RepID=UPI001903F25E|nr:tRNA (adenosine(37)-N6)-threonylcarbamoyltransferase complex dimerization subunit type 1 TsaB [Marinobacter sp. 1-4A]MBK1850368.1 tRNA (adenosine(37)-N6)-threonylcarbamoyltransferase complex dimerization subunit type 1 TsaB [Marinobacter sp. 1-4A]MCK0163644.1 tRNA (adenosine(37)-N6)-threonylcarbamoyltransferase complex dimerization subunit type 1 TsaB [Marinobacter sp. S6332]
MKLLALDTSSEGCSAALFVDGEVFEKFEIAPRGHTRLLMPMLRELLTEQALKPTDLDALAFARGPGSFTGVRIATGVVQGLAWGLDLPVVPVSSLETVALGAIETLQVKEGEGIAVAFDARMSELYWGCFQNSSGLPELIGEERVCAPSRVALETDVKKWVGAGHGWAFRETMPTDVSGRINSVDEAMIPRASWVARLAVAKFDQGLAVPAEQAQPVYIRDEVTWKKLPGRE